MNIFVAHFIYCRYVFQMLIIKNIVPSQNLMLDLIAP